MSISSFEILPNDILYEIFAYLSPVDILQSFFSVCIKMGERKISGRKNSENKRAKKKWRKKRCRREKWRKMNGENNYSEK